MDGDQFAALSVGGLFVIFAVVGLAIGGERGRSISGFVLGLFFGPIGWIVVCLLPGSIKWEAQRARALAYELAGPTPRQCDWCLMPVDGKARACRYCGHDFASTLAPPQAPTEHQGRRGAPASQSSRPEGGEPATLLDEPDWQAMGGTNP